MGTGQVSHVGCRAIYIDSFYAQMSNKESGFCNEFCFDKLRGNASPSGSLSKIAKVRDFGEGVPFCGYLCCLPIDLPPAGILFSEIAPFDFGEEDRGDEAVFLPLRF
jgi:hypothetical protein